MKRADSPDIDGEPERKRSRNDSMDGVIEKLRELTHRVHAMERRMQVSAHYMYMYMYLLP